LALLFALGRSTGEKTAVAGDVTIAAFQRFYSFVWNSNCYVFGKVEIMARQFCLDLMRVSWVGTDGLKESDYGIVLEIEPAGGLVQTTVAIRSCSQITLDTGWALIQGRVTSCEEDAYGFIVNFAVNNQTVNWFPEYAPFFLHSADDR
jgi:hypothetical protein